MYRESNELIGRKFEKYEKMKFLQPYVAKYFTISLNKFGQDRLHFVF